MSFREKSAWIVLVSMLGVFGWYYGVEFVGDVERSTAERVAALGRCVLAVIVLQIVLHIVAAITNVSDANSPIDEREKRVITRSNSVGYHALGLGVLALFPLSLMGGGVPNLLSWAFFAMVASTIVVAVTQIFLFRREA